MTGAAPLAGLVHKFKPEVNPLCGLCGKAVEDIPHLFLECDSVKAINARQLAFNGPQLGNEDLRTLKIEQILNFCKLIDFNKLTDRPTAEPLSDSSCDEDDMN